MHVYLLLNFQQFSRQSHNNYPPTHPNWPSVSEQTRNFQTEAPTAPPSQLIITTVTQVYTINILQLGS